MKEKVFLCSLLFAASTSYVPAVNLQENGGDLPQKQEQAEQAEKPSRFTIGGYGEAVYSHNFYSDNYLRYQGQNVEKYQNQQHARFDLPISGKAGPWVPKSNSSTEVPKVPSR